MNGTQTLVQDTSVLIVGGGLVGSSLAIALDQVGMAVTLVEAAAPQIVSLDTPGARNLALARATVNGLDAIGVWSFAASSATPITHIRVSRAGEFGSTRITASKHGVDALGWTLPAPALGKALQHRLQRCKRLTRLTSARVEALKPCHRGYRVHIRTDAGVGLVDTTLLVGADGTESFVRHCLGIGVDRCDYRQTLVVSTVQSEYAHANHAFERFSDAGPVALLPLYDERCGLVLSLPADQTDLVMAMPDTDFMALVQRRFGWALGRLTAPGKRHGYAIHRVIAQQLSAPRAVLVGNAAQTVHPIGAQGFNLGLRDALTLSELVGQARDPGAAPLLRDYTARRVADRESVMRMSHFLARMACLKQPVLAPLRSLSLLAADRIWPLQSWGMRRGMGWHDEPPHAVLERVP